LNHMASRAFIIHVCFANFSILNCSPKEFKNFLFLSHIFFSQPLHKDSPSLVFKELQSNLIGNQVPYLLHIDLTHSYFDSKLNLLSSRIDQFKHMRNNPWSDSPRFFIPLPVHRVCFTRARLAIR